MTDVRTGVQALRNLRRGRGAIPALAATLWVGCSGEDSRDVGTAVGDPPSVDRREVGGAVHVTSRGPSQILEVYQHAPDEFGAPLLFLEGRAATPLPRGGSVWADMERGRLVVFDAAGRVSNTVSGGPEGDQPLTRPVFAAGPAGALMAVEVDGRALSFRGGEPVAWSEPEVAGAVVVRGTGALRAAVRTVFDVTFEPLRVGDPLFWVGGAGSLQPVGEITMPAQAMLASLANAGWAAPDGDDAVYYAPALRPELRRYRADGTLEWVATWPREGVQKPRFGVSGSTLAPVFRLIQQALAVGPDGRAYVLVTRGEEGPADRLLVFDREGVWVREGDVEPWHALYVGRRGHVYAAEPSVALGRSHAAGDRREFPPFELEALMAGPGLRLTDYRGRVVVVNFWASWCVPCRREMPLLSRLASDLDETRAVVLGLNEDVDPEKGAAFVEAIGGVAYPLAAGRGRLRDTYGYRGLPYTVVLDRDGRVARAFYGFGESIGPVEEAVQEELVRGS